MFDADAITIDETDGMQRARLVTMELSKVNYRDLNSRQKEIYNFQKVAALLADYGFNCIKLADDWEGADFIAYHKDGNDTLKVQLKSRPMIEKKYCGKNIYLAFPLDEHWYLIEHDAFLLEVGKSTNWLNTGSWQHHSAYSSSSLPLPLKQSISRNRL